MLTAVLLIQLFLSAEAFQNVWLAKITKLQAKSDDGLPPPLNPYESFMRKPTKGDLYSNEDLENLLDLHSMIQDHTSSQKEPEEEPANDDDNPVPAGLHDLVLETLANIENEDEDDIQKKIPDIRAIASDVDGTLLSSDHTLHPTTETAIQDAVHASFNPLHPLRYFFPATGKSRAGALSSLGPTIGTLMKQVPGVFVQGLYVVDANGDVIFEQKISNAEVSAAQNLATEFDLSLFAYDGDSMYCTTTTSSEHREKFHSKFGEPRAAALDDLTQYEPGFHKCLFMHEDEEFLAQEVRPKLEELASEIGGEVTQAVPFMLEWLPAGGSKANGVQKLCEHLGIDVEHQLLAMGDAENDVEMLQQAAIGVSMGNASPAAVEAADVNLELSNDMGGAGIAMNEYCLNQQK